MSTAPISSPTAQVISNTVNPADPANQRSDVRGAASPSMRADGIAARSPQSAPLDLGDYPLDESRRGDAASNFRFLEVSDKDVKTLTDAAPGARGDKAWSDALKAKLHGSNPGSADQQERLGLIENFVTGMRTLAGMRRGNQPQKDVADFATVLNKSGMDIGLSSQESAAIVAATGTGPA